MLRFYAASFGAFIGAISRAFAALSFAGISDDEARSLVRETFKDSSEVTSDLPISAVVRTQFQRLLRVNDSASGEELRILLRELHENLIADLSSSYFLMIPADMREHYEQRQLPFGESVSVTFPSAERDISAASRCLALDEWTACVFHLMRVLEHGLTSMALSVGMKPEEISHENWKNIIDMIERKIRALEQLPKSDEKVKQIKSLSSAAVQFRYFKDAWRNHVSHGRDTYDERSGKMIWIHVKSFMQELAIDQTPNGP